MTPPMGQLYPEVASTGEPLRLLFILEPTMRRKVRESSTWRLRVLRVIQWAADVSGLPVHAVTARGKEPLLETLPGVVEVA